MMCGMKFSSSVRYDAPPAQVYAMLTDPAFRSKAMSAQDARSCEVTVDGTTIAIDAVTPNTNIPGFARAFAGETTRSITTERWRDGSVAEFTVETPGKPSSITGTRRLVAEGEGTRDTFDAEAKVKVPLVGAKIEGLVASQFQDGTAREHTVGETWLRGER
jgi:carbon monoxide dehydrogenase subunit G